MSVSPTKKTATKAGESIATSRELELLAMAMQCNKNDIQIDYVKYAELAGLKNAASARAGWKKLKDKFDLGRVGAADGGDDETASNAPKTPASGRKRKAATTGDEAEETPVKSAKKGRKPAVKGKKAAAAADGDAEDGDEVDGAMEDVEEAKTIKDESEEV